MPASISVPVSPAVAFPSEPERQDLDRHQLQYRAYLARMNQEQSGQSSEEVGGEEVGGEGVDSERRGGAGGDGSRSVARLARVPGH